MFGRLTRTLLPTTTELLKPKIEEDVPGKLFKRKQMQTKYYNISAKELPPLNNRWVVHVKPTDKSGRWYKARVEKQVDVRSYDVRAEDGRVFRRNRRHLRSSKEPVYSSSQPVFLSMPDGTFTASLPPNEPVPGTSQEFSPPKETAAAEKPNTSVKLPADVSTPPMPVKPVGCELLAVVWTSRPPSHLKDFVVSK